MPSCPSPEELDPLIRWDPPPPLGPADASTSAADRFLRAACLDYAAWNPGYLAEAARLLAEHPELPRASLHVAAAAGNVAAARELLERDRARVNAKGGALGWEPLLYAAYSRIDGPGRSTLAVARLLLENGADPNAGFLWCGNVPPFTALTGAFGEGEDGNNQPPHPERDALARLLLEAGADPNDEQTLYNRHFRPDDGHLRLLFEHGLGRTTLGPWFARLGARLHAPGRMLVEELWAAARKGFTERVHLLVEHGVDVNVAGLRDGRTPYEAALRAGNRAIAEFLARNGARQVELSLEERFAAACAAGDRAAVRALLASHPDLVERLGAPRRGELVARAVEARKMDGLRLMSELGFDLSPKTRNTPLHDAAWSGDLELVQLLVELGADTSARDREYDATPLGWAAHNRQPAVVEYLLRFGDVFDVVLHGTVAQVAELLRRDPARARAVDGHGNTLASYVGADLERASAIVPMLVEHGLDLDARNAEGKTAGDKARAAGFMGHVELLRRHGASSPPTGEGRG